MASNPNNTVARFGIIMSLLLLLVMAYTLREQQQRINDQEKRLHRLETQKTYQGKDVNGNEVWSAIVVTIELEDLNKPKKSEAELQKASEESIKKAVEASRNTTLTEGK